MTETKSCCICNDTIEGWGNNPEPFPGEKCCDDCNDRFVTPTRLCLGRDYHDESVLMLIQTIAELGKCFKRMTREMTERAASDEASRKPF